MNKFVFAALVGLFCLLGPSVAKESSPKVQVYSRLPGEFGKSNTLICHVSGFHPPEIKIELLRNGNEIVPSEQTDLAFEENWHYHLTKYVTFTPQKEDHFACRVTHMNKEPKLYIWDPDM